MSHAKARKETNCLNCNAEVSGRYCSVCGQENIEPKETLWQLLSHFVDDLFHYDGKAVSTLKTLIFKPGILTLEYVRGRRASYLHPIRLYIFISAAFFVIFISFIASEKVHNTDINQLSSEQLHTIDKSIDRLKDSLEKTNDPVKKAELEKSIDALKKIPGFFIQDSTAHHADSDNKSFIKVDTSDHAANFLKRDLPGTLNEYYKQQAKLAPGKRDGWLLHIINMKLIQVNEKYRNNISGFIDDLTEHFFNSLPTMMFVSLPIVAFIFQLLYIRRRKQFTYLQHGVFSVHIYIAMYIFILLVYGINLLQDVTHWQLFGYLSFISVIGIFYYLYRAMRNFYDQKRWKTIVKFLILFSTYFVVLSMLMIIFFMTSLIQI